MQKKNSFAEQRRQSRRAALQALYQWQISKDEVSLIEKQFKNNHHYFSDNLSNHNINNNINNIGLDEIYFTDLLRGVILNIDLIDNYIKRYITRALSEIDIVELTISRIAAFELLKKPEIPHKVIINEALELAKLFGGTDGHKFVNGVCDKIAREIRHSEIQLKIIK